MKITLKYGLSRVAGVFLLLWCLPWGGFVGYALYQGQFTWGEGERSSVIFRESSPVWYWCILAVVIAMVGTVLSLTLELSTVDDDSADEHE